MTAVDLHGAVGDQTSPHVGLPRRQHAFAGCLVSVLSIFQAASHAIRRAASISMHISASINAMLWNWAIGRPNAMRSLA